MRQYFALRVTNARFLTRVPAVMVAVLASTALPAQVTPPLGYTLEVLNLPANAAAFQMNNAGRVVGLFAGDWGGWVLENGQFTDIVHPAGQVQLAGINDRGTVFGYYEAVPGGPERIGFSQDANGNNTDYVFPAPDVFATRVYSGNNRGDLVGSFETTSSMTSQAFVRDNGGVYTNINPPNSVFSEALGINDNGVVTGFFFSGLDGMVHGFQCRNGVFDIVDHSDPNMTGTDLIRTNANGESVGHNYTCPNLDQWGTFLRTRHGAFVDISYADPDPLFLFHQVNSINARGDILGIAIYLDPASPIGIEVVNYVWRRIG